MNQDLTNILTKIQDYIALKVSATADPTKILAEDLNEILTALVDYLDNAGTGGGSGTYNLDSPTTIAVGSMPSGTDLSGMTWQEIIQYMTTGTVPPAAPQPVSSATATPQSSTEILLTWTNPA